MEQSIIELEQLLQLYERSMEVGRVGGWIARAGGDQELQLTDEARRILGFEREATVRNIDLFNVLHPDDRDRFLKVVWTARSDLVRGSVDIRIVRADGSLRLARIIVGPLGGEDQALLPLTGIIQDVTHEDFGALDTAAARKLRFERELHHAIDQHELFVEYQPIKSLTDGRYIGAEALVRWQHPELGALQPGSFIGVAEETGAIVPLGAFVLRRACQELRRWLDSGAPLETKMSVNLSAAQFQAVGFVETLSEAVAESQIPADSLVLEITESLLVEGALGTEVLGEIHQQGVQIAIDDFGTKYSALSYLTHLNVDALKVDESFVRSMDDEAGRTVVTAVAALGRALGLHVTAEGIETDVQLDAVRAAGCDAAQGFLFSPPIDGETCLELLRASAEQFGGG